MIAARPAMYQNEEFILGNASLHLQLSTALEVMTQIICNASHPPSAAQLAESLELSVRYLRKLLRALTAGGLLKPHEAHQDCWICTRAPHAISLADIYHCLDTVREESAAPFVAPPQTDAVTSSADLLMMQATVSINQIVLQHLQRFDLGRLKAAESAMLFTASLREKARALSGAMAS
ncbi:Rrf2 family transcriptional regulator [Noviherbaspirillum sp. UKPF54]|uniref:Rrf2 family transcriptional regulator n=1 Tax=Noviherbaspirillum sp. UKPF54 TaxID=2601898 RepID=UPI0011B11EBC|nr:Rrf2 family transcriptional regulator [Noviherbaspirillum sp. UKPF54]QDZ29825.1 Rrf2 family transcriptional regulator [Noviherbaspirillum sp. UKPF54]